MRGTALRMRRFGFVFVLKQRQLLHFRNNLSSLQWKWSDSSLERTNRRLNHGKQQRQLLLLRFAKRDVCRDAGA